MPWIDLKSALKSEAGFLEFIRSSYRHGTVVALCAGAIGILNRRLEAAVARKDRDGQRYLYTQIEVLRSEMHGHAWQLPRRRSLPSANDPGYLLPASSSSRGGTSPLRCLLWLRGKEGPRPSDFPL